MNMAASIPCFNPRLRRRTSPLSDDRMERDEKGGKSGSSGRLCPPLPAIARLCSPFGGGVVNFLDHRRSQSGNNGKPRFSLDYEGFFTLPLTLLNKKS